ncbi:UxaA family hydrolase [Paenibacillus monticola]|uniref:Altronate dehydratase n=1 Tax=Paenibacillus monticola TaxID=2666075 RepID=A0A7X2HAK3_9BACL|nr:altronate dehydratase family protein [Paenibacillus monticola]MRN56465.1 altronate dehydratase [Paenibacillus monticola]
MKQWISLHEKDDVIIALKDFLKGEEILFGEQGPGGLRSLIVLEDVPSGHKIAIHPRQTGDDVFKYGYSIGKAKSELLIGDWVHHHNLGTGLKGILDYAYQPTVATEWTAPTQSSGRTFQGYLRSNGEAGIRNEIWIINTVGCINKTSEILANRGNALYQSRDIDGIHYFSHPYGCSQLGDDHGYTQQLLTSLALHPNAGGVLVVGLGCENNQIDAFQEKLGEFDPRRIKFMKAQEVEDEIESGLELLGELVDYAETFTRQPLPLSMLKIGLKCGGSDGLSGITANPLVGAVSDWLISEGGTAILTEVPEMFGAETILMNRAANAEVFGQIVELINDFKQYFLKHDQEIYENPSPGNKAGGISTLEEKSLGCTQKGGHGIVTDVRAYGERVTQTGLSLLQGPGNDLVSVTALTAAGAHLVLFTTGRGTPFGGPVPTIKIASNSGLAVRKPKWIDFNAGKLVEGADMKDVSAEFAEYVIRLASGEEYTRNELNGFREIAIFKDGVIL